MFLFICTDSDDEDDYAMRTQSVSFFCNEVLCLANTRMHAQLKKLVSLELRDNTSRQFYWLSFRRIKKKFYKHETARRMCIAKLFALFCLVFLFFVFSFSFFSFFSPFVLFYPPLYSFIPLSSFSTQNSLLSFTLAFIGYPAHLVWLRFGRNDSYIW